MAATSTRKLISETNTSIRDAKNKYDPLKDSKELGDTFHAAAGQLPLIEEALRKAKPYMPASGVPQAVAASLDSCKTTAAKLETIFNEVSAVPDKERREYYVTYIKRQGRGSLVEGLVIEMMEYVCQMATNDANGEDLKAQLAKLQAAIDTLEEMPPSVPMDQQEGGRFINNGGEQYNATDNARQFNKSAFHGAVTFN
jgi:hypothetical protein